METTVYKEIPTLSDIDHEVKVINFILKGDILIKLYFHPERPGNDLISLCN